MSSLKLFISWAAVDADPQKLAIADDPDRLRREDQRRRAAAQLWDSWVLTHLGSVVNNSGTEGRAELGADQLADLDDVRRQVSGLLDAGVSVGVGMKVSEADEALKAAQRRGGSCIVLFTPDLQSEKSPDQELGKAEQPGGNAGAHAGFAGKTKPAGPAAAQSPMSAASAHSQGEVAQSALSAMPEPEMTHAAADFEQQFSDHADAHDEREASKQQSTQAGQDLEGMKQKVVKILQGVREQAPQLELMRQTEPELYSAVQGLVRTLILMAHQLVDGQLPAGVQKSEDPVLQGQQFFTGQAFLSKSGEVAACRRDALPADFEVEAEGYLGLDGCFYGRREALAMSEKVEVDPGEEPPRGSKLSKVRKGRDIPAKEHQGVGNGAAAMPGSIGSLACAELPMPEDGAKYHPKNLPPGSQKDAGPDGTRDVGKVKVLSPEDGKTKWRQVRAGQVMAPDGTPTSSRNPSGT